MRGHPHLNNLSHHAAYCLIGETRRNASGVVTYQAAFTYDSAGNRLSQTVNGVTTNYTYNALDQLVTAGTAQYEYDGRGNLRRVTDGTEVATYTWDAADRLTGVILPDGSSANFGYDADGRRVRQATNAQVINYLWDEASPYGDVLLETDASRNTLASYVLGGTELLSQARDGIIHYYLQDAQGSVRTLTDASGNVTDAYAYTAFGETLSHSGASANPYRYTGQQFDALSGLYYLRARYYDPALGRFLSRDPAEPQLTAPHELNRYVYVADNPINFTDPSGLLLTETAVDYDARQKQNEAFAAGYYETWTGGYGYFETWVGPFAEGSTAISLPPAGGLAIVAASLPLGLRLLLLAAAFAIAVEQVVNPDIYTPPQPHPQPGPQPRPDPSPPDTEPTPTPEPTKKHIALGLNSIAL